MSNAVEPDGLPLAVRSTASLKPWITPTLIVASNSVPAQRSAPVWPVDIVNDGACEQLLQTSAKSWLALPDPVPSAAMFAAVTVIVMSPDVPAGRNTAS